MRAAILMAGLAALVGVAALLWPSIPILEVVDPRASRTVLCAAMPPGDEFVLRFVHSVNKRPVYDTLRVDGDEIVIVGSRFDAFGAGMPETTTEAGVLRVRPDGWLEWTTNRRMPEVVVRVGRVASHTLIVRGREVPLADLAEPGASLAFRGRLASRWSLWKGRCLR